MTQWNNWTATRSAMFVRTNASCGSNRIRAEQLTLNLNLATASKRSEKHRLTESTDYALP